MDRLVRRLLAVALSVTILDAAATGVVLGIVANGQSNLASVQTYDHNQSVQAARQTRNGQKQLAAIIEEIEIAINQNVDTHIKSDLHQAVIEVEHYFAKQRTG